jgi:hypothetical protein
MSQRILTGLIAVGILIAFIGMLFIPAAFNGKETTNDNLMGGGLAIFALGALMISTGLYAKSRVLRAKIESDPNMMALLNNGKKCDVCRSAGPVVQCTMHRAALCSVCLNQHYDNRACVYVPATRRLASRAARASAGRG